jgi:hypothetical protein
MPSPARPSPPQVMRADSLPRARRHPLVVPVIPKSIASEITKATWQLGPKSRALSRLVIPSRQLTITLAALMSRWSSIEVGDRLGGEGADPAMLSRLAAPESTASWAWDWHGAHRTGMVRMWGRSVSMACVLRNAGNALPAHKPYFVSLRALRAGLYLSPSASSLGIWRRLP